MNKLKGKTFEHEEFLTNKKDKLWDILKQQCDKTTKEKHLNYDEP